MNSAYKERLTVLFFITLSNVQLYSVCMAPKQCVQKSVSRLGRFVERGQSTLFKAYMEISGVFATTKLGKGSCVVRSSSNERFPLLASFAYL